MPGATFTGDTLTVSQSWINTFMTCPERARLELVGEMPRSSSDATAIGSSVHAYIEQRLAYQEPDVAVAVALNTLEQLVQEEGFRWHKIKTLGTAWQKTLHCCSLWERDVWPIVGEVACIEERFTAYVGEYNGVQVIWDGAIDAIIDDTIWDWKTAGQAYDGNEYRRWAVQPTFYWFGARQLGFGELPFRYAVMFRDADWTQFVDVERNQGHVDWLLEVCGSVVDLILSDAGRWPLQSGHWLCSEAFCGNFGNCRGKFLAK